MLRHEEVHVYVRVVDARNGEATRQIDPPGIRSRRSLHFLCRPDGDDPAAANQNRLDEGRSDAGEDPAIQQQDFWVTPNDGSTANGTHEHQSRQNYRAAGDSSGQIHDAPPAAFTAELLVVSR
jgi:hypothetical protein